MFDAIKKILAQALSVDIAKFEIADDCQELSHPHLYYNLGIEELDKEILIGHYKFIPGTMYRMDGSGEPDEYDYIFDIAFPQNQIDNAISTFITMEKAYRQKLETENNEFEKVLFEHF